MTDDSPPSVRLVTISATYGAGASVVAPGLATRLGLQFFDRLIKGDQGQAVDQIMERLTNEEREQTPPGRIIAGLSSLSSTIGLPMAGIEDLDPRGQLRRQVEIGVSRIASDRGGVILGRAAAVVLAEHPASLHVRLHGPAERCLEQGMRIEGISREAARTHQTETDRSWSRFVTRLFDRDPADVRLYHLVIDSTTVPLEACVELIAVAASALWQRVGAR